MRNKAVQKKIHYKNINDIEISAINNFTKKCKSNIILFLLSNPLLHLQHFCILKVTREIIAFIHLVSKLFQ